MDYAEQSSAALQRHMRDSIPLLRSGIRCRNAAVCCAASFDGMECRGGTSCRCSGTPFRKVLLPQFCGAAEQSEKAKSSVTLRNFVPLQRHGMPQGLQSASAALRT